MYMLQRTLNILHVQCTCYNVHLIFCMYKFTFHIFPFTYYSTKGKNYFQFLWWFINIFKILVFTHFHKLLGSKNNCINKTNLFLINLVNCVPDLGRGRGGGNHKLEINTTPLKLTLQTFTIGKRELTRLVVRNYHEI